MENLSDTWGFMNLILDHDQNPLFLVNAMLAMSHVVRTSSSGCSMEATPFCTLSFSTPSVSRVNVGGADEYSRIQGDVGRPEVKVGW